MVDSYKKEDENQAKPKAAGTGRLNAGTGRLGGTGQLNMDSFASSGTSALNRAAAGSTRRLSTGNFDADKTLSAMNAEVDNGTIIVQKLESRVSVMKRALQIVDRPVDVAKICTGISPGEANFTKQVATMLQRDPSTQRRVQVAVYQFDQAEKGLAEAQDVLRRADDFQGLARTHFVESNCQVEKLRGQLYPLINLHVVFKDNPLLAQLIPAPKVVNEAPPPPPPPPPVQGPAKPAPTGPLADPAVAQMVDKINQVTGNLKDMFFKKK